MKIELSISIEKKSDGTFEVVSPSLLDGKPTTCNFYSTEAIGDMRKKTTAAEMERAGVTHNKETQYAGCIRAICSSNRRLQWL